MKVSLVVAQGVHQGKTIPITVPEFLIGRDETCQLRPASQAISKQHCAVIVRGTKVFVKDFGSTNGTFVNNEQVAGEIEIVPDDLLRAGPLEFRVKFVAAPATSDSKPTMKPSVKPDSKPGFASSEQTAPDQTVSTTIKSDSKPAIKVASKPAPTPKPVAKPRSESELQLEKDAKADAETQNSERLAAILLGMGDDDDSPSATSDGIPEGSTIMEMPAIDAKKTTAKKDDQAQNSNVAADILKMYTQRRRT